MLVCNGTLIIQTFKNHFRNSGKKVKCKRLMNIQISYFTKSELSASFIRQSMQFPDKEEINSNPIQNLDTGPP